MSSTPSEVLVKTVPPAEIFKALGHPARVQFIKMLGSGEKCVCDLVDGVDLGWSTVSRHLSVLKDAGIIADEKRGLKVFYRINLPCVIEFINCLDNGGCDPSPRIQADSCGCH